MVVNLAHKAGGDRGRIIAAERRRGLTAAEFELWNVPLIDRMTANQFERWLVQKFGPAYLEPGQLFKDGGGI